MIVINDKDEFKKIIKECLAECLVEMGVKNINMNEVRAPVKRTSLQQPSPRQKTPAQIIAERTNTQQKTVRQGQEQQKNLRSELADRLGINQNDILQEIFEDTLRSPNVDEDEQSSVLDDPRARSLLEGNERWASIVEKVK